MEITFELENSDLVFDFEFESDVLSQNVSDQTQVRWKLQNGGNSYSVADVFDGVSDEEDTTYDLLPNL